RHTGGGARRVEDACSRGGWRHAGIDQPDIGEFDVNGGGGDRTAGITVIGRDDRNLAGGAGRLEKVGAGIGSASDAVTQLGDVGVDLGLDLGALLDARSL